jgi:hypothetical protein
MNISFNQDKEIYSTQAAPQTQNPVPNPALIVFAGKKAK